MSNHKKLSEGELLRLYNLFNENKNKKYCISVLNNNTLINYETIKTYLSLLIKMNIVKKSVENRGVFYFMEVKK